jgi:hypothetical protein
VQSYAETLRQFGRGCTELGLPEDVEAFTAAHVYVFMGWVRERGVSAWGRMAVSVSNNGGPPGIRTQDRRIKWDGKADPLQEQARKVLQKTGS